MSDKKTCACPAVDAIDCDRIRYGVTILEDGTPITEEIGPGCECWCHEWYDKFYLWYYGEPSQDTA